VTGRDAGETFFSDSGTFNSVSVLSGVTLGERSNSPVNSTGRTTIDCSNNASVSVAITVKNSKPEISSMSLRP